MKVEQALRLLPDLEALMPLRARILASARADEFGAWASDSPYLTVGRRDVSPAEIRRRTAQTFHVITGHLSALYDAYCDALDALERDDPASAVSALLKAGHLEDSTGRLVQALAWFEASLGVAAALPDRRPEIRALLALGHVSTRLGRLDESARHHQRAFALAEAEFDQAGAVLACRGIGTAALERGDWGGAQAWFERALRLAEAAGDLRRQGQVHHALGELSRRMGDLATAADRLQRARVCAGEAADPRQIGRILNTQGLVEAARNQHLLAAGAFREALAWSHRGEKDPDFQLEVRLNLAASHAQAGRPLEAETELRRAEHLAISGFVTARLADVYVQLGRLRGEQRDETGFVFFEQALELVRARVDSPLREAEVYHEYARFRRLQGQEEEARAYLECARGIYASAGAHGRVARIDTDLEQLSA